MINRTLYKGKMPIKRKRPGINSIQGRIRAAIIGEVRWKYFKYPD